MAYERHNFTDGNPLYAKSLNDIEDWIIDVGENIVDEILERFLDVSVEGQ